MDEQGTPVNEVSSSQAASADAVPAGQPAPEQPVDGKVLYVSARAHFLAALKNSDDLGMQDAQRTMSFVEEQHPEFFDLHDELYLNGQSATAKLIGSKFSRAAFRDQISHMGLDSHLDYRTNVESSRHYVIQQGWVDQQAAQYAAKQAKGLELAPGEKDYLELNQGADAERTMRHHAYDLNGGRVEGMQDQMPLAKYMYDHGQGAIITQSKELAKQTGLLEKDPNAVASMVDTMAQFDSSNTGAAVRILKSVGSAFPTGENSIPDAARSSAFDAVKANLSQLAQLEAKGYKGITAATADILAQIPLEDPALVGKTLEIAIRKATPLAQLAGSPGGGAVVNTYTNPSVAKAVASAQVPGSARVNAAGTVVASTPLAPKAQSASSSVLAEIHYEAAKAGLVDIETAKRYYREYDIDKTQHELMDLSLVETANASTPADRASKLPSPMAVVKKSYELTKRLKALQTGEDYSLSDYLSDTNQDYERGSTPGTPTKTKLYRQAELDEAQAKADGELAVLAEKIHEGGGGDALHPEGISMQLLDAKDVLMRDYIANTGVPGAAAIKARATAEVKLNNVNKMLRSMDAANLARNQGPYVDPGEQTRFGRLKGDLVEAGKAGVVAGLAYNPFTGPATLGAKLTRDIMRWGMKPADDTPYLVNTGKPFGEAAWSGDEKDVAAVRSEVARVLGTKDLWTLQQAFDKKAAEKDAAMSAEKALHLQDPGYFNELKMGLDYVPDNKTPDPVSSGGSGLTAKMLQAAQDYQSRFPGAKPTDALNFAKAAAGTEYTTENRNARSAASIQQRGAAAATAQTSRERYQNQSLEVQRAKARTDAAKNGLPPPVFEDEDAPPEQVIIGGKTGGRYTVDEFKSLYLKAKANDNALTTEAFRATI